MTFRRLINEIGYDKIRYLKIIKIIKKILKIIQVVKQTFFSTKYCKIVIKNFFFNYFLKYFPINRFLDI